MTAIDPASPPHLEHDAFLYGTDDEYVAHLVPAISEALGAGAAVFLVVPAHNARLLRDALGHDAGVVTWIAAEEWYRHPARTIAAYERTLRHLPAGTTAFVVGEVQFGHSAGDHVEWTRYEALLNRALEGYPARVVCPYDTRALPHEVVALAARTHPNLLERQVRGPSVGYVEPEVLLRQIGTSVVVPERPADIELEALTSPRDGRTAFAGAAMLAGLAADRVDDLVVGISEVLTNAIVHGGGAATMRIWVGSPLVCTVEDPGPGTDDVLLGFRSPGWSADGGYGVWYARQAFDKVELSRSPLGGLRVTAVAAPD